MHPVEQQVSLPLDRPLYAHELPEGVLQRHLEQEPGLHGDAGLVSWQLAYVLPSVHLHPMDDLAEVEA